MIPNVFIIIIAVVIAIFIARLFPYIGEIVIVGGAFLLIEAYKFYLQPALDLPLLPMWFILFVGVYIGVAAFLIIGRHIPYVNIITKILANG